MNIFTVLFLFTFTLLPPELPKTDFEIIPKTFPIFESFVETNFKTEDSDIILTLSSESTPSIHPLYETFSPEELDLLFRIVECEARDGSIEVKANVASVIFNRWKTNWGNGDLTTILMSPKQFEVVTLGLYKDAKVTASTIEGCELAFEQDTVDGAIFFDSTGGKSWAANECKAGRLVWVKRDEINHDFYKKK